MIYIYPPSKIVKAIPGDFAYTYLTTWAEKKLRMSLNFKNDELVLIFIKNCKTNHIIIYTDLKDQILDIMSYDFKSNPILFNDFGKCTPHGWFVDHIIPKKFFDSRNLKAATMKKIQTFLESYDNLQPLSSNLYLMKNEQKIFESQFDKCVSLMTLVDMRIGKSIKTFDRLNV